MKKCEEYMQYSVLCQGCSYPNDIKCCKKVNNKEILEKQDQGLNSLKEQYNKLLEERCFTAFDLLAEELKNLDYCSGLILTGDTGEFEFSAIENDKRSNLKEKLNLTRILSKYDNFRGIQIQIYDEKNLESIKEWQTIVKEIKF